MGITFRPRKTISVFPVTFLEENRVGRLGNLLFNIYLGYIQDKNLTLNSACPKMAIKTSGKALKTKVGRVSGNIVVFFFASLLPFKPIYFQSFVICIN
jgi:hypothetical protein